MKFGLVPVALGVCSAVLLAGCGSSTSHSSTHSSGSPASTATTAAPSPAPTPASLAQVQKIVLTAADLPAGWKATPSTSSPSDAADQAALVKCVGGRNTDPDKFADAKTDDFTLGGADISSSATSYKSASDIAADVAILHSPKLSTCYGQLAKSQATGSLPAGAVIKSATFTITPGSNGGPSNIAATGTGVIQVQINGLEVPVYLNVAFITGPLLEASVNAESAVHPVSPALVNSLVSLVAARAARD